MKEPPPTMRKRKIWWWLASVAVVGLAAGSLHVYRIAKVGSGFSAEIMCGGVFVSGRAPDDVRATDLSAPGNELLRFFSETVDRKKKRVTASAYGFAAQTAIYRDGLGCTLLDGRREQDLRAEAPSFADTPSADPQEFWPEGERADPAALSEDIDKPALDAAIEAAFAEPDPERPRNTWALVVVYRGRLVAERYAPGFNATTPLIGWSMTKSALNCTYRTSGQGRQNRADRPGADAGVAR